MRRLASVYHAGDTGYVTPRGPAPFFAEIGERFGPLDLVLVPIWRGGSPGLVAAMGLCDEVLGLETQVLNRETADALNCESVDAGAGLLLLGKTPGGVLRKLTSLSNHGSGSNSRAGSSAGSGDEAEPDGREGEHEAGRWKDKDSQSTVSLGSQHPPPVSQN
ncbi:hypothetical protein EXIGLDRAFT_700742 [Exidia glandulosa HHB12029]|uniref:Uncharacterized protein n=1 Tax=Exidia glandulosa HHB12029 TaxID=1314781 RepID=A0A165DB13_EXIGL|nr:hypothetical protein EXIGLDRAFT_700742 [Exidia glandulosa HHB12029]